MKYLMASLLVAMTVGFVGCNKENNTDSPDTPTPQRPDGEIAIRLGSPDGSYAYDGDTIRYTTTAQDMEDEVAAIYLFIDNQTGENIEVMHSYETLAGPTGLSTEVCANMACPWSGEAYSVAPGVNSDKPFTIKAHLVQEYSGETILYKVVTGKGRRMENAVTTYVQITVQ